MMTETKRVMRLNETAVSKGSPQEFGVANILNSKGIRRSQTAERVAMLVNNAIADPYQWYNWKFYYPDNTIIKHGLSSYASVFNTQGTNVRKDPRGYIKVVKDAIIKHGGQFDATYTQGLVESDQPSKGNYMAILFVRWLPDKKASAELTLGKEAREEKAIKALRNSQ